MTSHLLPTYGRVNLSLEGGQAPGLFATDGERYLDVYPSPRTGEGREGGKDGKKDGKETAKVDS